MAFDPEDEVVSRSAPPQRVKKPKEPPKYPLGVWVELDPGEHTATWVRTVQNLPMGRVDCVLRSGVRMIVPRSMLPKPEKRKRPRR